MLGLFTSHLQLCPVVLLSSSVGYVFLLVFRELQVGSLLLLTCRVFLLWLTAISLSLQVSVGAGRVSLQMQSEFGRGLLVFSERLVAGTALRIVLRK